MRTPPPTPNSPLNSPAAVPIAASLSVRRPAMRAILGAMSAAAALAEALAPLRSDPARAAILLDIDGTLAPIVRHADDAAVPEATRAQLIAVAKRYAVVGCISGRRSTTARQMVALGSIAYAGNHGSELLEPGATVVEIDPEIAAHERKVRDFAAAAYTPEVQRLRVRSEDKQAIMAFHWRGAPDEDAAEQAVREIAAQAEAEGLRLHWGRKVLEVRPPIEINKGRGVRLLIEGHDLAAALYVGDDMTDLDAFAALRELVAAGKLGAAVCVGVRSEETPPQLEEGADLLVDGPAGVVELLRALAT
jgi:trehalose 6-phosphate phosphatase